MSWPRDLTVIPIITLPDPHSAVPLAAALLAGGIAVVEVTMRTPAALEGIRRIRAEVPDVLCGAGTVLGPRGVEAAVAAGAQFLVSPGSSTPLLRAMRASALPCLPGACTPSEAMAVLDEGFELAKFFPAEAAGGVATLRALAGPLASLSWCATGGVTLSNAGYYLALPQVVAVGGSWLTPAHAVAAQDWTEVTALCASTKSQLGVAGHPHPA